MMYAATTFILETMQTMLHSEMEDILLKLCDERGHLAEKCCDNAMIP